MDFHFILQGTNSLRSSNVEMCKIFKIIYMKLFKWSFENVLFKKKKEKLFCTGLLEMNVNVLKKFCHCDH